jgi:hypothetical protein
MALICSWLLSSVFYPAVQQSGSSAGAHIGVLAAQKAGKPWKQGLSGTRFILE